MAAIGDDALEDMFVREVKGLRFQLLKKYEERCCLFFEYNAHLATQEKEALAKQLGSLARQQEEELCGLWEDKCRKYAEFSAKLAAVVAEIDMLERRFRAKFEALRWAPGLVAAVAALEGAEEPMAMPMEEVPTVSGGDGGMMSPVGREREASGEPATGPPLPYDTATMALLRRQALATGQPLPRFLRPAPGGLEPVKVAVILKRKINSRGTYYPDLHKVKPDKVEGKPPCGPISISSFEREFSESSSKDWKSTVHVLDKHGNAIMKLQEWIQDNCPWNLAKKSEKAKRRMESEKADEADAINALASLKRRG